MEEQIETNNMNIQKDNYKQFVDRNNQLLQYGDKVLAKVWSSYPYTKCTVIGFTPNYVVVIIDCCQDQCRFRKSTNLVKVNNLNSWKLNF